MPELPEVETVRLGLAPAMEGYTLTEVETRRGDLRVPFPKDFIARTKGRKVRDRVCATLRQEKISGNVPDDELRALIAEVTGEPSAASGDQGRL